MSSIAILSTGDEVVEGEILNTNAQAIAQKISELGFYVREQLACRDDKKIITDSLSFLFKTNDFIITIGGLGPTADDLTRFSIAALTDLPLEFHQPTWQWIKDRYDKLGLEIPETNKQQALFPKGADILANEQGSADGALIHFKDKVIIMLPGPPSECLPMVDNLLIPYLESQHKSTLAPLLKWRVFGISESLLAEKIKNRFKDIYTDIAYRWEYPYIDVKYRNSDETKALAIKKQLDTFLNDYIICANDSTATLTLKKIIELQECTFNIDDRVTGGFLQTQLLTPMLSSKLSFRPKETVVCDIDIFLDGLLPYWRSESDLSNMTVEFEIIKYDKKSKFKIKLPEKPHRIMPYVLEFISAQLTKSLAP